MKKHLNKALICNRCSIEFALYGYPCIDLINFSCLYYRFCTQLIYDENYEPDNEFKTPLNFLEKKGILVSTEIDEFTYAILPNFKKCQYNEENDKFCWCRR